MSRFFRLTHTRVIEVEDSHEPFSLDDLRDSIIDTELDIQGETQETSDSHFEYIEREMLDLSLEEIERKH